MKLEIMGCEAEGSGLSAPLTAEADVESVAIGDVNCDRLELAKSRLESLNTQAEVITTIPDATSWNRAEGTATAGATHV